MIEDNYRHIQERIVSACKRSGRDPSDVRIIAVTKGVPAEQVREAIRLGIREVGENRTQEALMKHQCVEGAITWHMIGHLQTNKVLDAVTIFSLIHSVDSVRLAKNINQCADAVSKIQDVLIQVNISDESSKFGVRQDEIEDFIAQTSGFLNIRIAGLMGMARIAEDPEEVRPSFSRLRAVFDRVRTIGRKGVEMKHLSMGMSQDFEVAIEEGATMVRIGTALFKDQAPQRNA
ncbi:MAG: YggS family pyridoxal phosphate-dependent enzyme [Candidatus Omnitrophota bacterium]